MMKPALHHIFSRLLAVLLLGLSLSAASQENRVADLRGYWKFEIGDDPRRAEADFDDSRWESIFVPSTWEDEGFPGYDGFAWFRRHFTLNVSDLTENRYVLNLGRIDDADETYVNGHLVGFTGRFPPKFETAYNLTREYNVPREYLNLDGENVVAVRVFDGRLEGGIIEGRVGLYRYKNDIPLSLNLEGVWQFRIGDDADWRHRNIDTNGWENILVPMPWELQGYRDYDGFAWYRKTFRLPERYRGRTLYLLLGKIDDLDQTYLNGELIGSTGRFNSILGRNPRVEGDEWQVRRAYRLDEKLLNYDGENLIAVRVFDGLIDGGIFEGPVGIVTEAEYQQFLAYEKPENPLWQFFFNLFKADSH
ncbi:MAG: beta galactosidase jelly roll domain-containing protein [Calditrichaeota bacterium]|nr:beta galactosidase jelly roll domain-containing protein [Calditrichota bacterium]